MPGLGKFRIDDNLTIYANTHDPSNGAAADATGSPSYRVYEEETATPILTGSLALLDSANTTGFYSELIALTAANGFENGKSYGIYIEATVAGVLGTMHHHFKVEAAPLPAQNAPFDNLEFLFVAASDHVTPVTGAGTMAVTRSIDGGAFASGTGTGPTEVGNGIYQYDASAADMNGGIITFRFTAASGTPGAPDDVFVTVVTRGGV